MNKKLICLLTAATLITSVFTGCSGTKNILSYDSTASEDEKAKTPSINKNDINAVLIVPNDPSKGACMSAAHAEAFTNAAKEMGIEAVSTVTESDPESAISKAGDANVVFGGNYIYMNTLDKASSNSSDNLYSCFGGFINRTNYTNYNASFYEAQFLAGIAAGMSTKSGTIGIISDVGTKSPESAAEINSFALGVRSVNSSANIVVVVIGSGTDMSDAEKLTKKLIRQGSDIISIQCDSTVPATIAAERKVSFIGYGTDLSYISDEFCLTSVTCDFEEYYKSAFESASDGTWTEDNYHGNLENGSMHLSSVPSESVQLRIDNVSALIKENSFEIFSNYKLTFDPEGNAVTEQTALLDNQSNVMIAEDGSAYYVYGKDGLVSVDPLSVSSDVLAYAKMNYLVEGVTVIE